MFTQLLVSILPADPDAKIQLAYLDPNTGSLIIQAVIGGILGITFFARTHIANTVDRLRDIFGRNTSSKD